MTLPNDVVTVPVVETYEDTGGNPLVGSVIFTPVDGTTGAPVRLTHTTDGSVWTAAPIQANLSTTGQISLSLLAVDSENISPTGWCWRIEERIPGGQLWFIQPLSAQAPGPVLLSAFTPYNPPGSNT